MVSIAENNRLLKVAKKRGERGVMESKVHRYSGRGVSKGGAGGAIAPPLFGIRRRRHAALLLVLLLAPPL